MREGKGEQRKKGRRRKGGMERWKKEEKENTVPPKLLPKNDLITQQNQIQKNSKTS
jgi:hypothetical protein